MVRNKKAFIIIVAILAVIILIGIYGKIILNSDKESREKALVAELSKEELVNKQEANKISSIKYDSDLLENQVPSSTIQEDNLYNLKKVLEYISDEDEYKIATITESSSLFALDYDETLITYAVPDMYRKSGEKYKLLTKFKSIFVGKQPKISVSFIYVNFGDRPITLDENSFLLNNTSTGMEYNLSQEDNKKEDFSIKGNSFKEVSLIFDLQNFKNYEGLNDFSIKFSGNVDGEKFTTNVDFPI